MKDALGNDIVLGNRYGYSRNQNGFTYVRLGTIIKINAKSVLMKVEVSKRALYSNDLEPESCAEKISIKSNMLFPIV